MLTDPNRAVPLLRFVGNGLNPQEGIAAAIVDYKDGLQEMHFYFEQAYWMLSSSVRCCLCSVCGLLVWCMLTKECSWCW